MKKWEFPNQRCGVYNCKKGRKYLAIFQGFIINLCATHKEDLEEHKPLDMKNPDIDNCMRIVED